MHISFWRIRAHNEFFSVMRMQPATKVACFHSATSQTSLHCRSRLPDGKLKSRIFPAHLESGSRKPSTCLVLAKILEVKFPKQLYAARLPPTMMFWLWWGGETAPKWSNCKCAVVAKHSKRIWVAVAIGNRSMNWSDPDSDFMSCHCHLFGNLFGITLLRYGHTREFFQQLCSLHSIQRYPHVAFIEFHVGEAQRNILAVSFSCC